jgi:uncharacterized protein
MKIVWDEPKRLANLDKHGLDFADLNETFFDNALVFPSHSKRWRGIGKTIRGVVVVVFVTLGKEAVSVISTGQQARKETLCRLLRTKVTALAICAQSAIIQS